MKKITFPTMALTLISLLFIRCNAENMENENSIKENMQNENSITENMQNKKLMTENATIYYQPYPTDFCVLGVATENNGFYALESLSEEFREDGLKVKISYLKTDRPVDCGFGQTFAIEIKKIEKIE